MIPTLLLTNTVTIVLFIFLLRTYAHLDHDYTELLQKHSRLIRNVWNAKNLLDKKGVQKTGPDDTQKDKYKRTQKEILKLKIAKYNLFGKGYIESRL